MEYLENHTQKQYGKAPIGPLEQTRIKILQLGYGFIERKSAVKKFFRESYLLAKGAENYINIPLSAMDGQRGKRSF